MNRPFKNSLKNSFVSHEAIESKYTVINLDISKII